MLTGRAHVDWVQVRWSVWTMIEYDVPEITAVFRHGGVRGLATWIMEGIVDIWDAFPFFSIVSVLPRVRTRRDVAVLHARAMRCREAA